MIETQQFFEPVAHVTFLTVLITLFDFGFLGSLPGWTWIDDIVNEGVPDMVSGL